MNKPLMQIPTMPELWGMEKLYISHKALKGALAHWAAYQSPDVVPPHLGEAVAQFMHHWPHRDLAVMSSADLQEAVMATIRQCPLVEAWNRPRPYDFIDLHAFARNVTKDVVLWERVHTAQDAQRTPNAA